VNTCVFSPCRSYRYTLKHRWDELMPERVVMWIGLNPSTADESALDPTLRRVKAFSAAWGFNAFVMTNLFAFRATDPKDMMRAVDPIGPENDRHLIETMRACEGAVVAAWGNGGRFNVRTGEVVPLLQRDGARVMCLGLTGEGFPRHPLYVAGGTPLQTFNLG
jgi:hypothetical protein